MTALAASRAAASTAASTSGRGTGATRPRDRAAIYSSSSSSTYSMYSSSRRARAAVSARTPEAVQARTFRFYSETWDGEKYDMAEMGMRDVPSIEGPSCIRLPPIEAATVEELEALYAQWAKNTYFSGQPVVDDAMFDTVERRLRYLGSDAAVKYPRCSRCAGTCGRDRSRTLTGLRSSSTMHGPNHRRPCAWDARDGGEGPQRRSAWNEAQSLSDGCQQDAPGQEAHHVQPARSPRSAERGRFGVAQQQDEGDDPDHVEDDGREGGRAEHPAHRRAALATAVSASDDQERQEAHRQLPTVAGSGPSQGGGSPRD